MAPSTMDSRRFGYSAAETDVKHISMTSDNIDYGNHV